MSESKYYDARIEVFRQRYPADEWEVYALPASDTWAYLPDFIKARAPNAAKKMEIIPHLLWRTGGRDSDSRDAGKLESRGWDGEIDLTWQGKAIHCRYISVMAGYFGDRSVVLVATKSKAALADICGQLQKFNHDREKEDHAIKVINGRSIPRPESVWEDICLPDGMAEDIRMATETFFKSEDRYRKLGLAYRRGFLFTGPGGVGKTLTTRVIAATQAASCVAYVPKDGSNEPDHLDRAFEMAGDLAPSILVLEDLDKFGRSIAISQLLNRLDGLDTPRGVLVIGTSNEPDRLDPALLLRPSRFDRVWTFPLPNYQQRLNFLVKKGGSIFKEGTLHEIAKRSDGFSVAYLQEVFATATAYAVNAGRELEDGDMLASLATLRKQIKTATQSLPKVGTPTQSIGFSAEGI